MKNEKKIVGLILVVLSICFFSIFIWWGTTNYKGEFGIGIFFISVGTFLSGLKTYHDDY